MDVKTVFDFVIYLGGICAALTAIGLLGRFVVVRPLKHFILLQLNPLDSKLDEISKKLQDHLIDHP